VLALNALGPREALVVAGALAAAFVSGGCKPKVSATQCEQLLDRYAQLVVIERHPDASAPEIDAERQREKSEARGDDAVKNCSSEVSQAEFDCAMRSPNADAFEKCLE
jgi:hypothetical protein